MKTLTLFGTAALLLAAPALRAAAPSARFAYGTPAFTQFLSDSVRRAGAGRPHDFYAWLNRAYQASRKPGEPATLSGLIAAEHRGLASLKKNPARRTQAEQKAAARLHALVKTAMPHFSLEEGFEFTNAVKKGERQCLLQSVLLAGLMQAEGVPAGVVMVNKSISGEISNNGHCVTLLPLADGRALLLDASDPIPFVRHQGLFTMTAEGYQYIAPVYAGTTPIITAFAEVGTNKPLPVRAVRSLDTEFLRSQFDYYRGERAPGGLMAPPVTPEGLAQEIKFLRSSVRHCPQNPLAVYMLGRAYLKQGNAEAAQRQLAAALPLYAKAGWVPDGPKELASEIQKAVRKPAAPQPASF